MKRYLLCTLLSALLLGCSSTDKLSNAEKNIQFADYVNTQEIESLDRITSFRLHGWHALSNQYITISTFPKKRYLVSLRNACTNLTFSNTLIVHKSSGSSLQRFDSVASIEAPKIKCFIDSIYKLTPEQYDAIKAIDNTDKNMAKQAPKTVIEQTLAPHSTT